MKTLADFKRDCKAKAIRLELVERYGNTGDKIREHLRGVRSILKVGTVKITLVNGDGRESALWYPKATLLEYDGEMLTIYQPAEREPNEQEREVLAGAQAICDSLPDWDCGYWKLKRYFANSPCPWLDETGEYIKGKRYSRSSGKVYDEAIKGAAILKYKVYRA